MGCSGCESKRNNSAIPKKNGNVLNDRILQEFNKNEGKVGHGNDIHDYQIIKQIG